MTVALEGGEWSAARPGRTLPPGKTQYPLYRRLGGHQGRSGRVENLAPTRIQSRTVQPVAQSLYRGILNPMLEIFLFGFHKYTTYFGCLTFKCPHIRLRFWPWFSPCSSTRMSEGCGRGKKGNKSPYFTSYQNTFWKTPTPLLSSCLPEKRAYIKNDIPFRNRETA